MKIKSFKYLVAAIAIAVGCALSLPLLITSNFGKETAGILESQGYTNIQIHEWVFLGCDRWHVYRAGFTAATFSRVKVSGVVCRDFGGRTIVRIY